MTEKLSADLEWDRGHGTRDKENGRAKLLPSRLSGTWDRRHGTREKFGLTGRFALPDLQTPNKSGSQKSVINHWLKPVAWVVLEHIPRGLDSLKIL
jgi:hypothetical protein